MALDIAMNIHKYKIIEFVELISLCRGELNPLFWKQTDN